MMGPVSCFIRRPSGLLFSVPVSPPLFKSPGRAVSGWDHRPTPQAPERLPRRSQTGTSPQVRCRPARFLLSYPGSHRCTTFRASAAAWALLSVGVQPVARHTVSALHRKAACRVTAVPSPARFPAPRTVSQPVMLAAQHLPAVYAYSFRTPVFRSPAVSTPEHSQKRCTGSAPDMPEAPPA